MKIILITGASGSGKTTILKKIEKKLNSQEISINHFDDIGVPSFEDMISQFGSCEKWQEEMTYRWIENLSKIKDKKFVFLEGSFNPEFAVNALKKFEINDYLLFCVDVSREIREKRLIDFRNQPELATDDMESFAQFLKIKTIELCGRVINSSDKSSDEILSFLIHTL